MRVVYLRVALFLVSFGYLAVGAMGFEIVSKGSGKATIVVPERSSPVVRYAAEELQKHIDLATGVKLPIVPDATAAGGSGPFIYVGPCSQLSEMNIALQEFGKNEYIVKTTGNEIVLAGKDDIKNPLKDDFSSMGSLLAVYKWIQGNLGARWIWPGDLGTYVPKVDTLQSGEENETVGRPKLAHSRLRFSEEGVGAWTWNDPAKKNRFVKETSAWLRRHGFVRSTSLEYDHAYQRYWELFGKDHPEFFAMSPQGKRGPVDERADLVQMCVSDPGLHKQIIADWLVQRQNQPTKEWINGCENDRRDIDLPCYCEKCREWDSKQARKVSEGNQWFIQEAKADGKGEDDAERTVSDRYAKFWLELQKEGMKTDPEAKVFGLAYAGYSDPPLETKLNERIIVGIVPPYDLPSDLGDRSRFREIWDGWAGTGAKLFLRPNYTLDGYCLPYVFAHQLGEEYQYAAKNGMIATDFDSLNSMWGVQGPNIYVLGRLNESPEVPVDELLGEFYSAFGPASEEIKAYFDFWESVTSGRNAEFKQKYPAGGWATMSRVGNFLFTPEKFAKGRELLAAAKSKANGQDEFARRVDYLSVWLTHADLAATALTAHQAFNKYPSKENKQAMADAKKAVDEYREAHPEEFSAANLPSLNQLEQWVGWRAPAS
jgi:hypothetical protein